MRKLPSRVPERLPVKHKLSKNKKCRRAESHPLKITDVWMSNIVSAYASDHGERQPLTPAPEDQSHAVWAPCL